MINYEVKVFNKVHAKVAPLCAEKMFVSTPITKRPTAFPAGSLIEMDNTTIRSRQSSTPIENFALITYQLEIYATTKNKCKSVFSVADEVMISMNFARISGMYVPDLNNTKVARYVARYEAVIDRNGNIYRR